MAANMQRKRVRIGDLLVEQKIISEAQLQAALAEQKKSGRKLGRVLIENGFVDEDRLLRLLSEQLDIPYVDLSRFELDPELVGRLPETHARRYRALVLKETAQGLLVGMGDPTDIFAFDELVRILKTTVQIACVKESDLLHNIDRLYQHADQLRSLANEVGQDLAENAFDLRSLSATSSQSDAPVVRLIQTVFEEAVRADASDIHIEPDEDVLRIRRRIDGVLHETIMDDRRIASAVVSRLKLMAEADISEKRLPQDGRFTLRVLDKSIDVRLATIPTQTGEAVVMRLLDHGSAVRKLDQLGMSDDIIKRFRNIIHRPHGLVLVTGPTGSGKTTTLYGALAELNKPQKKIITVEDPVEYQLPRINQVQVNHRIELGFARVLRTALRLDPDIILVGEMRDMETGEIGLRAALTGHLVL
ncbi:MAG: Flp pilus assembly complex ATPase component TadA, partial [Gammaproteobacteria bacterium]